MNHLIAMKFTKLRLDDGKVFPMNFLLAYGLAMEEPYSTLRRFALGLRWEFLSPLPSGVLCCR